ncbi:CRISPR-associated helicase Cas3' [Inmirania thermothiophila]|uniref:CRISPR-associated Cas3 family helicase n=1 Tax=Inmirania thermothiophila TaxID=1750597 RepID=A0A3N1Y2F3_9GAMM|nr:CRISPR-associated helicase Cas3' [Inmirania thermothiophila]ROR32698.1 CRISPR-associated Cas3 family helicase [Inmirania thermothiophila]
MSEPRAASARLFWGKCTEGGLLPLSCHALDVALTFRTLCGLPGIRRALEAAAGRHLHARDLDRLAVLALLHDVGKANLGFQYKVFPNPPFKHAKSAGHVAELAALFDDAHPELNQAFARALQVKVLSGWFAEDGCGLEAFLLATWSHHGRPVSFAGSLAGRAGTWARYWRPYQGHDPMAAVAELVACARKAFPAAFEPGGVPLPESPRFQHLFAGLVMLADWLGSHPHWFPVEDVDPAARLAHGRRAAARQLQAVGLDPDPLRPVLAGGPSAFQGRFPFAPRPLQQAVHEQNPDDSATRLLIAESETGSGKTEAALDWFFTLFAAGRVDGLYFALPTRVAARELYTRVQATMARWFPAPTRRPVTVLAVPGYAQVDGLPAEQVLPPAEAANLWQDDAQERLQERVWAIEHPKRFLAATVAVGTIDQALLSAVQTKHAHLRGACLARSLLVVDEVHASDRYMSRLLEHLLEHHLALGGYAMLLSATLGAAARERYLAVARGQNPNRVGPPPLDDCQRLPYPRLTRADGSARPCGRDVRAKAVAVEEVPLAFAPEALAERIAEALRAGARVMVVMNTVARANALHRALERQADMDPAWGFRCAGVPCPHHGRFAPEDRLLLDAAVSARLGKEGPRGPVLLIGTQTLEQSLDIDADLLVTDLCPADVLLQRIGRLHRHNRSRPHEFEQACCLLLVPEGDLLGGLDEQGYAKGEYRRIGWGFGAKGGGIYEDLRTLELTRRALAVTPTIEIPADNRRLVEEATHPESLAALEGEDERWARHGQRVLGGDIVKGQQAEAVVLHFDRCFGDLAFNEMGLKVATRLGAEALRLPLDRPVTSPFGQALHEITIPEHLAPEQPEEKITVEDHADGVIHLRCAGVRYTYSRHGLEKKEEP